MTDSTQTPISSTVVSVARPGNGTRDLSKGAGPAEVPDLAGLQKRSFEAFLQTSTPGGARAAQGLEELLATAFAQAGSEGMRTAYQGYRVIPAAVNPAECRRLGRTYSGELLVRLGGADGGTRELKAVDFPFMTDRGTFVVGGVEKVVIGRLQAEADTHTNDLTTRRLLLVGHQLQQALAGPLAEDLRAELSSDGPVFPRLASTVKSFFRGGGTVCRAETTNPLALVSQLRSVRQCGVDRTPGYSARCVHPTHFGRLCLLETPEGERIGVNLSTAILAEVDSEGRLLTPYEKRADGRIELLTPEAEAGKTIGDRAAAAEVRKRYGGGALARVGDDFARVDLDAVEYTQVHPAQALGASASLIPLVAHDDANRALMGTNMQKQAVPLLRPEAPIVQSGMEAQVAADARVAVRAGAAGVVVACTPGEIRIEAEDGSVTAYPLEDTAASPLGTDIRQRAIVELGQQVADGQVIADGPATDHGVLALGRNVLVGYMPWEGYNFEDGTVISDRLVKDGVFTSVKMREYVVTLPPAYGDDVETLTTEHLPPEACGKLSADGVVREGATVEGGDVLVAKRVGGPEGKDTSLRLPLGQRATVVRVEHYATDRGDALAEDVGQLVRVVAAEERPLRVGDKLCNRHGAKGVVARIVPEADMPVLPDGRVLEAILNPLGVPSRMNLGSILETHLGLAAHELGCTVTAPGFCGASVADIEAMLVEAGLPASGMVKLRDGRTGRCFDQETTVGYQYMMKLVHMVDDKRQERATGPYSPDTCQPVSGRRHGGGQHIGIMESWALQGHGAAHILREMLTLKSDDVGARGGVWQALLSDTELPRPTVPHSVKRLTAQLRGLCLDLTLLDANGEGIDAFAGGASVADAVSARVGFASPETVRNWSAGAVDDADGGDGLHLRHIALCCPVKHAWRELLPDSVDAIPDILTLPVLPPQLRGGSRLDRLYAAVRAADTTCREQPGAPAAFSALQEATDELLRALTRLLHGKSGWITAAVSGRAVDYSGRSVICPGPELEHDTCSLPVAMAAVLFEPFVAQVLTAEGLAPSVAEAVRMLRERHPEARRVLEEVAARKHVLLHRAPVLHRMGIQAFRVKIADEEVIRLHPLTNVSFNADFDGDEMDVFVPLSAAAQHEATQLLSASRCQMGPAHGLYLNTPSQDMAIGCYYATCREGDPSSDPRGFGSLDELDSAFRDGLVHTHETVVVAGRMTTVGRGLLNRLLPETLRWIDEPVGKPALRRLLTRCWHELGPDAAAALGDSLMRFGFRHATLSGLSIGKDTLRQVSTYDTCLAEAWRTAGELQRRHERSGTSAEEVRHALTDHWAQVTDQMATAALAELAEDQDGLNPLHLMLASAARGNRHQLRQLLAMRGLMAMPDRRIIGVPFTQSFVRGHTPLEYFAAAFGARKGLADTALKTSEAGFLFKRIMNAVQDIVVTEDDCGTCDGLVKAARTEGGHPWLPLAEQIVGRTALADVVLPGTDRPVVRAGETVGSREAAAIEAAGVGEVGLRSPVTCRSETGVCATCYGLDLSTWEPPGHGLAVGVIAAQSIGEPGTQLTMRTFAAYVPRPKHAGAKGARADILGGLPRIGQFLELWSKPAVPDPEARRKFCELRQRDGVDAATEVLLAGMQKVYREQGVRIDDRHFEIVLKQMLGPETVGVTEAANRTDDFVAAGSSYDGVPSLARAALHQRPIALNTVRSCTAFGKLIPCPGPR